MSNETEDEFYVGYVGTSPAGIARRTRMAVVAYVVMSMIVATVCVGYIARTGKGKWESSTFQTFRGVLRGTPYPMLELREPIYEGASRTALLVDFGKRGAQKRVSGYENKEVEVTGTVLSRDGRCVIELGPDADSIRSDPEGSGEAKSGEEMIGARRMTLRGEIVDPKCYLGGMKPGEGKTHKDCAVRCISGGIPPALVCWDETGRAAYYVLTDETGGAANEMYLDVVGEAVEVTGEVGRIGDLLVMRVSRGGVKRL